MKAIIGQSKVVPRGSTILYEYILNFHKDNIS